MKNNSAVNSLINFLVPIIFLYALFFLADVFVSGFFAVIYSVVLLISGSMLFFIGNKNARIKAVSYFDLLIFFLVVVSIAYLLAILFLITDSFK